VEGDELQRWVQLARRYRCSLILDEFYSHFIYTGPPDGGPKLVSAASYVEDVNRDPVILVDGLTKGWRYPGWRISWTIGPKEVIRAIASAGSFLDGGANNPFQPEVLGLLDPGCVVEDAAALQTHFRAKRNYMLERLYNMGIMVEAEPGGTFYVWANLADLPEPLNDGMHFFEAGLDENVITVPGVFFDVNPERRRTYARYRKYCRVSFGPEMEALERGLDSIERVIEKHT
jgi:aspartate/methionine/tyrosine aminotransferase